MFVESGGVATGIVRMRRGKWMVGSFAKRSFALFRSRSFVGARVFMYLFKAGGDGNEYGECSVEHW